MYTWTEKKGKNSLVGHFCSASSSNYDDFSISFENDIFLSFFENDIFFFFFWEWYLFFFFWELYLFFLFLRMISFCLFLRMISFFLFLRMTSFFFFWEWYLFVFFENDIFFSFFENDISWCWESPDAVENHSIGKYPEVFCFSFIGFSRFLYPEVFSFSFIGFFRLLYSFSLRPDVKVWLQDLVEASYLLIPDRLNLKSKHIMDLWRFISANWFVKIEFYKYDFDG